MSGGAHCHYCTQRRHSHSGGGSGLISPLTVPEPLLKPGAVLHSEIKARDRFDCCNDNTQRALTRFLKIRVRYMIMYKARAISFRVYYDSLEAGSSIEM